MAFPFLSNNLGLSAWRGGISNQRGRIVCTVKVETDGPKPDHFFVGRPPERLRPGFTRARPPPSTLVPTTSRGSGRAAVSPCKGDHRGWRLLSQTVLKYYPEYMITALRTARSSLKGSDSPNPHAVFWSG